MEQPTTAAPSATPAAGPVPEVRELDFPPVVNGVDYLISMVDHLAVDIQPVPSRSLKFTVTHLHAPTEVLLNARSAARTLEPGLQGAAPGHGGPLPTTATSRAAGSTRPSSGSPTSPTSPSETATNARFGLSPRTATPSSITV